LQGTEKKKGKKENTTGTNNHPSFFKLELAGKIFVMNPIKAKIFPSKMDI
jgi:hypothetical protein